MNLQLIDCIGPFFHGYSKDRINWSKVPFENLEKEGKIDPEKLDQMYEDFKTFASRVSAIGYNSITLDDVAHMTHFFFYPKHLQEKIEVLKPFYHKLITYARKKGMRVFITTDVLFSNRWIERAASSPKKKREFLKQALQLLFHEFDVQGVILRIGESDGLDVSGDFKSELVIRTPKDINAYLKSLLPLFESEGKLLILRTWSVGSGKVGDMMWNKKTLQKIVQGIGGSNFILSMKPGDADFFRYLPTNPLFFATKHPKIVEFQARREYEGFGIFPSFLGEDITHHLKKLKKANLVGMSMWCQTGGWSKTNDRTFIEHSSVWNEINTEVGLYMFQGASKRDAIAHYAKKHRLEMQRLTRLLELSELVIKEGLYFKSFAQAERYFRRIRVPPLLWIFWDYVTVTQGTAKFIRRNTKNKTSHIKSADTCLKHIEEMHQLALDLGLPTEGIVFQYETFQILRLSKHLILGKHSPQKEQKLMELLVNYQKRYPHSYQFNLHFPKRRTIIPPLVGLVFRKRPGYRLVDYLFLTRPFSYVTYKIMQYKKPKFVNKQGMPLKSLFQ